VTGAFVGLTEAEILEIREQARVDIKAGRVVTSYTAPSGIQVGKQHLASTFKGVSPQDVLLECRYALQQIDGDTYGRDLITDRTKANFL
jgi:hypothetical protein